MKKSLMLIVSFLLLLIFASAYSSSAFDGKIGKLAPLFSVSNNDVACNIGDLKGKYVLLSFWSSADAESRIHNISYDAIAKKNSKKLTLVSVNYDRNQTMFESIVLRDKLQEGLQFFDRDGSKSKVYNDYHLDQGYKSYLVNPAGEIIAINPSTSQLATLLRQ